MVGTVDCHGINTFINPFHAEFGRSKAFGQTHMSRRLSCVCVVLGTLLLQFFFFYSINLQPARVFSTTYGLLVKSVRLMTDAVNVSRRNSSTVARINYVKEFCLVPQFLVYFKRKKWCWDHCFFLRCLIKKYLSVNVCSSKIFMPIKLYNLSSSFQKTHL